jgi:hypothetical protein
MDGTTPATLRGVDSGLSHCPQSIPHRTQPAGKSCREAGNSFFEVRLQAANLSPIWSLVVPLVGHFRSIEADWEAVFGQF